MVQEVAFVQLALHLNVNAAGTLAALGEAVDVLVLGESPSFLTAVYNTVLALFRAASGHGGDEVHEQAHSANPDSITFPPGAAASDNLARGTGASATALTIAAGAATSRQSPASSPSTLDDATEIAATAAARAEEEQAAARESAQAAEQTQTEIQGGVQQQIWLRPVGEHASRSVMVWLDAPTGDTELNGLGFGRLYSPQWGTLDPEKSFSAQGISRGDTLSLIPPVVIGGTRGFDDEGAFDSTAGAFSTPPITAGSTHGAFDSDSGSGSGSGSDLLPPTAGAARNPNLDAPPSAKRLDVTLRKAMHSREEFAFVAYFLYATSDGTVDVEAINKAVREGHRHGLADAAIVLGGNQLVLAEWDGSYWHGDSRLQADMDKTHRMLKCPNAIVVRVRVGKATDLPVIKGAIVVRSARGDPSKAVQSLVKPLTPLLAPAVAEQLRRRATGVRVETVEDAVNAAWGALDPAYALTLKQLEVFAGSSDLAKRLKSSHGVVSRPEAVLYVASHLCEVGMRMEDVVRMPDSFWAACDRPDVPMSIIADLSTKGVDADRLAALPNSFWSAAAKRPTELAATFAVLAKLSVAAENLPKFPGQFWSTTWCHEEVLVLLTNDMGLRASDLHLLRAFWTTLKSREDVDALRAELTALRTSSDVTKRLREKNKGASIGKKGAQRSQSSLNAFFTR